MPAHDDTHFDEYLIQTQAKHKILTEYLPSYLNALKNQVNGFHYIDGFAGRGIYDDKYPGSPILVLDIIRDVGVANKTSVSFVEKNPSFLQELNEVIGQHEITCNLYDTPRIEAGKFEDYIDNFLNIEIYSRRKVATFAFIDPCGVDGIRMQDINKILNQDFGEVLLFFNYDGVNRLIGGALKGTHDTRILDNLFGSPDSVAKLVEKVKGITDPIEKERIILDHFVTEVITSSGARYILPFRFQAKNKDRTSHYLVHCCDSCLAFCLIKHVMRKTGTDLSVLGNDYGSLEFLSKDEAIGQTTLFAFDDLDKENEIIEYIKEGPRKVETITKGWVCRPTDTYSAQSYKRMLTKMESENKIVVFDKNNEYPEPADKRRKSHGKPTLADDYWLRFPE